MKQKQRTSIGKINVKRIVRGVAVPETAYISGMVVAAIHAGALKPSAATVTPSTPREFFRRSVATDSSWPVPKMAVDSLAFIRFPS